METSAKENELRERLEGEGFTEIAIATVYREARSVFFVQMIATPRLPDKPAAPLERIADALEVWLRRDMEIHHLRAENVVLRARLERGEERLDKECEAAGCCPNAGQSAIEEKGGGD